MMIFNLDLIVSFASYSRTSMSVILIALALFGHASISFSFSSSYFQFQSKKYVHQTSIMASVVPTFTDQNILRYYDLPGKLMNVSVVDSLPLKPSTTIILVSIGVRSLDDVELPDESNWNSFKQRLIKSEQINLADDKFLFSSEVPMNEESSLMVITRIPIEMYQKLELARKIVELSKGDNINVIMLDLLGERILNLAMGEALQAAFQLSRIPIPTFKRAGMGNSKDPNTVNLTFHDASQIPDDESAPLNRSIDKESMIAYLKDQLWVNAATSLTRALAVLPPNILHPKAYVQIIKRISEVKGFQYEEWTPAQLRVMGCGAFYAVTQANGPEATREDRLIRLRYTPVTADSTSTTSAVTLSQLFNRESAAPTSSKGETVFWSRYADSQQQGIRRGTRPVVLVGKGVTFDTGGINLKSANSMKTMKHDMSGSAAALATLITLASTHFPQPAECWLAIAENNNGREAFRPDDVVSTVTGETIEIVHSDAEGRMLLADVLALASRQSTAVTQSELESTSPALLIDFATLTGTCISSLSNRYIGALSNRPEYVSEIIAAGARSGERAWPFPLDEDFAEDLKSDVADVLQV